MSWIFRIKVNKYHISRNIFHKISPCCHRGKTSTLRHIITSRIGEFLSDNAFCIVKIVSLHAWKHNLSDHNLLVELTVSILLFGGGNFQEVAYLRNHSNKVTRCVHIVCASRSLRKNILEILGLTWLSSYSWRHWQSCIQHVICMLSYYVIHCSCMHILLGLY